MFCIGLYGDGTNYVLASKDHKTAEAAKVVFDRDRRLNIITTDFTYIHTHSEHTAPPTHSDTTSRTDTAHPPTHSDTTSHTDTAHPPTHSDTTSLTDTAPPTHLSVLLQIQVHIFF